MSIDIIIDMLIMGGGTAAAFIIALLPERIIARMRRHG